MDALPPPKDWAKTDQESLFRQTRSHIYDDVRILIFHEGTSPSQAPLPHAVSRHRFAEARLCFGQIWMRLMDNILVNPPQFVVYLLAAFAVHMRGALMSITYPPGPLLPSHAPRNQHP